MQLFESRLSYFNDKARIDYCTSESPSAHQHGGPSRPCQNCHSCIFETKNSNLRICLQYLGHHSKTTCQNSAKIDEVPCQAEVRILQKITLRLHIRHMDCRKLKEKQTFKKDISSCAESWKTSL